MRRKPGLMDRSSQAFRRDLFAALLAVLLFCAAGLSWAADKPPRAAIAGAHPLATAAGFEVLEAGGNAFDAAVAVSAALAVVEPYGSGLGGGGFWLLYRAEDGRELMLDGRERAPSAARHDMYADAAGRFAPELSLNGPLAAGIPGEPAALVHLAEHYGRLPLMRSLAPAIGLARDGFVVDEHYRRLAQQRLSVLRQSPAAAAQFLRDGEAPPAGTRIPQPDLADTLERIATAGREGFYAGRTAQLLIAGVRAAGGIWTPEDLAAYQVVERAPVVGHYHGRRVVSAAPPSSGGILLVQMLNMLSHFDLAALTDADRAHLMVEVMRRAYRDRALYLGDPDFVEVPVERLIHPFYAAGLVRDIDPDRATPSRRPVEEALNQSIPDLSEHVAAQMRFAPCLQNRKLTVSDFGGTSLYRMQAAEKSLFQRPAEARAEGADTSHFSILDREGNRVAATLSINYPFGSGFVPPGTGVLLNDEMDDFSVQPGVPNVYGLIGGEANAVAPGKRMLSSMTPTFVESEQGLAILGTPGGSRIITMVLQSILSLDAGSTPVDWVAEPRFHHQYLPDRIQYEPGAFGPDDQRLLAAKGHDLEPVEDGYGNMQAVYWDRLKNQVQAVSDPRGIGAGEVR